MNEEEVRQYLRDEIRQHGTAYKWSAAVGVNRSVVHKFLNGIFKQPPPQLLEALDLKRTVSYDTAYRVTPAVVSMDRVNELWGEQRKEAGE